MSYLLLALTLALAPTESGSRLQLDATGTFAPRTFGTTVPPNDPPSGHEFAGTGVLGLTVFGRRLVDDDAPMPLQAYLQRVPRFHIAGGGGGSSAEYPIEIMATQSPSRFLYRTKHADASAGASADGYVGRWAYLRAAIEVNYTVWDDTSDSRVVGGFGSTTPIHVGPKNPDELALPISAEAGLRLGDWRVSAGWSVTPYQLGNADLNVRFWGGAFIAGYAVFRRSIGVGARVNVLEGGASVDASASFWLGRRLGLLVGVSGGRGTYFDLPAVYDRAGGRVGVEYWMSSRWAASLSYAPSWQHTLPLREARIVDSDASQIEHLLPLTLTVRPH
jgi:hypothetical protein